MQTVISPEKGYEKLKEFMKSRGVKLPLLVCGSSFDNLDLHEYFDFSYIRFSGFSPNPLYEQCQEGFGLFKKNNCDMIIAVGGGSAIDVAKCIRYYCDNIQVPLVAIPTTAGTGSESTRFAVVYKNGEKQSLEGDLCYPDAYILDASSLTELPTVQRKVTLLDALCHSIESLWSVRATEESKAFSLEALEKIKVHWKGYLDNVFEDNEGMLEASNLAGKAINISKTTAGHAMSYKLTSLYGIPHGQAVAACMNELIPFTLYRIKLDVDVWRLFKVIYAFAGQIGINAKREELYILVNSVNADRLSNHPITLKDTDIRTMYERILMYNAI